MDRYLPASPDPAPRRHCWRPLHWSVAAICIAGLAIGGFGGPGAISSLRAAPTNLSSDVVANQSAEDATTREFSRFALNALLVPLLDDDEPPRWSDVAMSFVCGSAAHVEVNGLPLIHGSRIPSTPFTLRWSMDQCTPLEAYVLNGSVELLVFQEGNFLGAIVNPTRLIVSSTKGTVRMSSPFATSMPLLSAKERP
jgi:hypothetical protein